MGLLSPNNVGRRKVQPQQKRKVDREKRCARPIYAQSYATKSPVLMISLSSKVSSMLWCKSSRPMVRACVSISQMCRRRTLWAFFIYKIETDKGRVVYVVYVVSRAPKSNKRVERLSLIIGALKICRRAVVLLPMPVERRRRGLRGKIYPCFSLG